MEPNHALSIRANLADSLNENIEPFGGITARSRGAALDARDYMLAASQTSVFGGRWVNELRFQFAYRDQLVRSLDPTCTSGCLTADDGGPTLEVAGVASVGRQRTTPQTRTNAWWQFVDTASLSTAAHLFKAGIELVESRHHHRGRAAFALRRPIHLSGTAGYSRRAARADLGDSGGGFGPAGGLRSRLRRRHRSIRQRSGRIFRPG